MFYVWLKLGWTCLFIGQIKWWTLLSTMAYTFPMRWFNIWVCIMSHGLNFNFYILLLFGICDIHNFFYVFNIRCMYYITQTYVGTHFHSCFGFIHLKICDNYDVCKQTVEIRISHPYVTLLHLFIHINLISIKCLRTVSLAIVLPSSSLTSVKPPFSLGWSMSLLFVPSSVTR